MTTDMEWVLNNTRMAINTKANSKIINLMVMVCILGSMVKSMKVNGRLALNKDKVCGEAF